MKKFEKVADLTFTKTPQTINLVELIRKLREKHLADYPKTVIFDAKQ